MQSQFYRGYAKTKLFKNKLSESINKIKSIDRNKNVMCLYSGGKDSTVVLDLMLKYCRGRLHEFHFDWGNYIPAKFESEIKNNFFKIFQKYHKSLTGHNFKQENKKAISGKYEGDDQLFFIKVNEIIKKNKIDIVLSSLRAQESIKRKNILTKQKSLFGAENLHVIRDWNTEDIWAYIFSNNLPFHSWYDNPKKRFSVFMTDGIVKDFEGHNWLWNKDIWSLKCAN